MTNSLPLLVFQHVKYIVYLPGQDSHFAYKMHCEPFKNM